MPCTQVCTKCGAQGFKTKDFGLKYRTHAERVYHTVCKLCRNGVDVFKTKEKRK